MVSLSPLAVLLLCLCAANILVLADDTIDADTTYYGGANAGGAQVAPFLARRLRLRLLSRRRLLALPVAQLLYLRHRRSANAADQAWPCPDVSGWASAAGACGYGNLFSAGYGTSITAVSTPLWKGGAACGACYELTCKPGTSGCYNTKLVVTVTDQCPDGGEWCQPDKPHFDLSQPVFAQLAQISLGHFPVMARRYELSAAPRLRRVTVRASPLSMAGVPLVCCRVSCPRSGGVKVVAQGNSNWLLVKFMNVAGGGTINAAWVKGSNSDWIPMSFNWGVGYQITGNIPQGPYSFQLRDSYTGQVFTTDACLPSGWNVGQTYSCDGNASPIGSSSKGTSNPAPNPTPGHVPKPKHYGKKANRANTHRAFNSGSGGNPGVRALKPGRKYKKPKN
eukprot:SM000056S17984  [mRNA]  locus=s56:516446:517971:+ [translate_table: standard]